MLWDVDVYRVLMIFILSLVGINATAILAVLIRRVIRAQYYQRLDAARERYGLLVASVASGIFAGDLNSLRHVPQTIEWRAIEELLLKHMEQSSSEQQASLSQVFEHLGYIDFYLNQVKKGTSWQRTAAAQRLGQMRNKQATAELLKALEDKVWKVRQAALQALGAIRDPESLKVLVGKLSKVAAPDQGLSRRLLMAALISYGETAVPLLMDKLSDPSDVIRALAAEILGEVPSLEALQALIQSLEDPNPEVRAKAAYALGRIKHPLGVKPLIKILTDPFWYVRLQAAKSLGMLASPQAIYALLLRLTDSNAQVRRVAAEALVQIGPIALHALMTQLLYTPDRYAREHITEILERYGYIEQWIEDVDAPDDIVQKRAQGLLMAAAQVRSLHSMLNALQSHPRPQARIKLVDILGKTGNRTVLKAIHRVALHDPDPIIRERAQEVVLKAKRNGKLNNGIGNAC